jgi:hypothetical protein
MRQVFSVALVCALLVGGRAFASGRCGDVASDMPAVTAAEDTVAAQCTCCGPPRGYAVCLAKVLKAMRHDRTLPSRCVRRVRLDSIHACPLTPGAAPCEPCNADANCGAGEFCECRVGSCAKTGGVCVARPEVCPTVVAPVCGCVGTTYGNDCLRQRAGACKLHEGPCTATTTTVPSTTTTTLPCQACSTDADCDDGIFCTVDRCVNGTCEHVCICLCAEGVNCCPDVGPCAKPCGVEAGGACGGSCPFRATCEPGPTATATVGGCQCVSSEGGPCGGTIDMPPAVCGPGLVCQRPMTADAFDPGDCRAEVFWHESLETWAREHSSG